MSHRLSMSRLALAHACAYSFRPDVEVQERPVGRAAKVGTVVHALADAQVSKLDVPVFPGEDADIVADGFAIYEGALRAHLSGTDWTASEVGIRYYAEDDASAIGPRRGEPGYGDIGAMVLPGTLDLVRVEEKRIVIRDIKTGKPPSDREQLYGQAVAASRAYNINTVEVGYLRALKTKVQELDVEALDADRLDEEAGRIRRLLRTLPTAEPRPGDAHCWKCDARSACPAFGAERAASDERRLEEAGFFG